MTVLLILTIVSTQYRGIGRMDYLLMPSRLFC
jgi:hypothetical protein